jgi:hypothetical protein
LSRRFSDLTSEEPLPIASCATIAFADPTDCANMIPSALDFLGDAMHLGASLYVCWAGGEGYVKRHFEPTEKQNLSFSASHER